MTPDDLEGERQAAMQTWLASLPREHEPRCVAVLGQMPRPALWDERAVVAVYPEAFRPAARGFAKSEALRSGARSDDTPLVDHANLEPDSDDALSPSWSRLWLSRGVKAAVRVTLPTALGRGIECFVFFGRTIVDRRPVEAALFSTMTIYPKLYRAVVTTRFDSVLTEQQLRTIRVRGTGLTAKQAAETLGLSPRTVEIHWAAAGQALGMGDDKAKNGLELMRRLFELGLF